MTLVRDSRIVHICPAMRDADSIDDDDLTVFEVALSDASMRRLMRLSALTKVEPPLLLDSIIHDVLLDDERAHHNDEIEIASAADRARMN